VAFPSWNRAALSDAPPDKPLQPTSTRIVMLACAVRSRMRVGAAEAER
jgi:hypothetical protein